MRTALAIISLGVLNVLLWSPPVLALDPSLDVSQYAHTAWKVRDGFTKGVINCIAQTPDGYLWIGTELGLYRFDGVRSVPWQPRRNESLPSNVIYKLFVSHDGALWIGTEKGLAKWNDSKLTLYPEFLGEGVDALAEDSEGTVWTGLEDVPAWRLCAIRKGAVQCFGNKGTLGLGVGTLLSDSKGNLWAGTGTGLWRWRLGSPESIPLSGPASEIHALMEDKEGAVLISTRGGIVSFVDGNAVAYRLPDYGQQFNPFKLLRDRDGGLWIGTKDRGLLHVHQGSTDHFGNSDGLSSDVIQDLLKDREGNIWVATANGLDRFREYAASTMSVKQGFSVSGVESVLTATDGSVWLGTRNGLDRWHDGRLTLYRKKRAQPPSTVRQIIDPGLPDDLHAALFEDHRGQIWVFSRAGAAYLDKRGRFQRVPHLPGGFAHAIAEDRAGDLWISQDQGFFHLLRVGKVERIPWTKLRAQGLALALASDPSRGGLWLGFSQGGVAYFSEGQVRQWYTAAEGLGEGRVNKLQVDHDGTLWVGTEGGLSRFNSGRINTLSSQNGLPCNLVHELVKDNAQSMWLNTGCGLVRIARSDLDAWVGDPKLKIQTTVLDSSDGLTPVGDPGGLSPRMGKSGDGKIWFVFRGGVGVVDPHHLPSNKLPPPVHIEQIAADGKVYTPAAGNRRLRLPPLVHDLTIDYTGLSFVAPEKVHFRFKLEGQDKGWREVVNDRKVQYSNLAAGNYRFLVKACNNSGVWNQEGAFVDFVIPPAWYQTNWFRALCAAVFLVLVWLAYRLRVRELEEREKKFHEAVESMPALAFIARPDGYRTFVNRGWVEYTGMTVEQASGSGWQAGVHPDDIERVMATWQTSAVTGEMLDYEARLRRGADGAYRWFQVRATALRDQRGKLVKWCGVATDIEDRKRAEEALRRLNRELRAISNCNQTLLRATDEQSLLEEICRIVCQEAGYCIAWVAYAEHDEAKSMRPVAWAGQEEGYLATAGITWAETEHGRGPTGTSFRSGKSCCIQDFATDPRVAPWRESALQRGFRSGIGLPLKDEHANAFGSLTIHSPQPNAFTPEEIRLLEELAADLAFGIVTLRSRAARKRAEEALRESETRFRTFVDHAADALLIYDFEQGTIVDVNRQACESLGYTRQELIGTTPLAFDRNVDRAATESISERTAAGETVIETHWHQRKDGTLFPVEVHTSQYWYGGRRLLLKLARDISDRVRAEEQRERLRQLEADLAHINRLSMMGELTASIAHEVNQPLSGVVTNGSACLRWLAGDVPNVEEAREAARRIVRDGKRAGEVISRVRALTKRAATPREKLDMNETIRDVLALVGDEARRKSVMIRTQFADDLSPISGDRVQLQQVVLNLVMNAIEAMSSVDDRPRELLITTRNIDADQVLATVKDSGTGIDPNTLDKIFDPFYTTKPGGMGMGLSISRSILQAHGGRLWATINDGPGTRFHFTLPNYQEE